MQKPKKPNNNVIPVAIHTPLQLYRGVRLPPPTSVLDITLNNLMVRF